MLFPDCVHGPLSNVSICDQHAPDTARIASLLSLLSVAEKFNWLGNTVAAIPRLGLPAYQWWEEALHGVAHSPGPTFDALTPHSTQFPQPLSLAASFNRSLWLAVGQRIADEARAFSNLNRSGLDYWTPNVNIFRDPRWGRAREVPGEDPFLTSQYMLSTVTGLQQGEDSRYLKVLATCKVRASRLDKRERTYTRPALHAPCRCSLIEPLNSLAAACVSLHCLPAARHRVRHGGQRRH